MYHTILTYTELLFKAFEKH